MLVSRSTCGVTRLGHSHADIGRTTTAAGRVQPQQLSPSSRPGHPEQQQQQQQYHHEQQQQQQQPLPTPHQQWSRRVLLGVSGAALLCASWQRSPAAAAAAAAAVASETAAPATASDLVPVLLQLDKAPDQSLYDPSDPDLREAAGLLQRALNAPDVAAEEALWSEVIERYGGSAAPWVPDVVGRAYGNRGNARSRQGKLAASLADFNAAISLCPWSVDPVINRGVVLEALGRWDEAASDYQAVLAVAPGDPSAWNNLGNTYMGMARWSDAEGCFAKAAALAPAFSFAAANRSLALFQLGRREEAIREMRTLLRRFPDFPDMRAALVAAQWAAGREGDAETNWQRVDDPRYRDINWLQKERRWPPALTASLQAFLQLKSI